MRKIILLRHGEVNIKNYKNISANQFENWIIQYNNSDIKFEFSRRNEIKNLLNTTNILICSNLKRSIQSIEIFNKIPFEINAIFNEAELPLLNWNLLKLSPKIWLIVFRILWFFGYSKHCESYKEIKIRTQKATKKLILLSKKNETIILIGHGIFNKLIQKELILNKWIESKRIQSKNWDYGILELRT